MTKAQERKNPQESFLRSEGRLQKGLQECKDFFQLLKKHQKTNKRKVLKMLAFLQNRSATGLEGASIQETARIYVGTPVSTGRTAGFIRPDTTTQPGPDESGPTDRINPVFHIISPAEVDARSSLDSSVADSPFNLLTR